MAPSCGCNNAAFTTDAVVAALPARGWRALGSPRRPKGYRFRARDAGGGAVRSALLAPNTLRIRGELAYTLDEPAQGKVAMRFVTGLFADAGWCAAAPPRAAGAHRSTARNDRPGRFVGAAGSRPPDVCPPLP